MKGLGAGSEDAHEGRPDPDWHVDANPIPIVRRPRMGRTPVRPWLTSIVDVGTRKTLFAVITPTKPSWADG